MKLADIDWSLLRSGLLVLPLALVVGALLFNFSYQFYRETADQFRYNDMKFVDVSRRYLQVDQDERIISDLYPRFVDLYNKGIIGAEQRLKWYEVLHNLSNGAVPSLRYKVLSRQIKALTFPVAGKDFEVFASDMQLEMDLLHEEELAQVLSTLEREATGLFSIEQCTLRTAGPSIVLDPKAVNLKASCLLRWYTLNLANGQDVRLP